MCSSSRKLDLCIIEDISSKQFYVGCNINDIHVNEFQGLRFGNIKPKLFDNDNNTLNSSTTAKVPVYARIDFPKGSKPPHVQLNIKDREIQISKHSIDILLDTLEEIKPINENMKPNELAHTQIIFNKNQQKITTINSNAVLENQLPSFVTSTTDFIAEEHEKHLVEKLKREILSNYQKVSWDDIAGCELAKKVITEVVVLPTIFPEFFQGIRRPWKSILVYGPPGTGKTMLAKAVASATKKTFFNITPSTLLSKWHGESEILVHLLFKMATHYAPSIIFIDEIDSLCLNRNISEDEASLRFKSELLVQMDGMSCTLGNSNQTKTVLVMGASNRPWSIDDAFLRRFEKRIYIPLPDKDTRRQLLAVNLKDVPLDEDVKLDVISEHLCGYSGSDICNVCRYESFYY
ncbi:unnamed protein product [Didymodactylos carnosus]|uniref:AAA+ ATPase domain-containing protein n=1 Tax=Didymodactylos carnosus TaxID=1234261 RepID=A0A813WPF1_9BILA|nr:unnamed protein product [Didymodactylos carnosus]CAF0856644.1 unnamed protein product [Didymodactylos carnosus]CAF3559067.1 unnamed protein product [Didymodactylos carnosus]CAF3644411.1 unnamed protein product [Didymodactylos carnosus]